MTDSTLESYIRQYIEASIENSTDSTINFVWHGGEPTLAGLDFYKRAVELQKRHCPEGRQCRNNLQTNGILLDEKWCEFLAENNFDIGLSIDGTHRVHDQFRKDHGGKGTYLHAAEGIRRLQAHGIQPDLLCTVTSATAKEPLTVYKTLRDFNTRWIQFIPIVGRQDEVSGEAYGNFLCTVFNEWLLNDLGRLDIQFFSETAHVLSGGSAGLCWMAPVCGRVLIIEQDGGIYSCDHYVRPKYRIGNINTTGLSELVNLPFQLNFGESKQTGLPDKCRHCKWLALCNGGCPKDRHPRGLNKLCAGLEQFFSFATPALSFAIELNKRGLGHEAIMSELQKQLKVIWKDIGRNDPCPCKSGKKAKHCCWKFRSI